MRSFKSQSQAGQDAFVHRLIPRPGTFLDIGSGQPVEISNTYALEQIGWSGMCVDFGTVKEAYERERTATFLNMDATTVDYVGELTKVGLPLSLDYLSLDVDEATLPVMRMFPWSQVRFKVLTVEHDRYRFGDAVAEEMRTILYDAGYMIAVKDVSSEGLPYEDWWVVPGLLRNI